MAPPAMNTRTKGCLWIAAGVVVVIAMVAAAAVVGVGYLLHKQFAIHATFEDPDAARRELDQIRAGFGDQQPRLHLMTAGDQAEVRLDHPASPSTQPLTALHVAVFDPSKHKLVRLTIPFWVLRYLPQKGTITVDGEEISTRVNTPSGRLTAEDLEALGPGLLIDDQRPGGERVIVWTE